MFGMHNKHRTGQWFCVCHVVNPRHIFSSLAGLTMTIPGLLGTQHVKLAHTPQLKTLTAPFSALNHLFVQMARTCLKRLFQGVVKST